MQQEDTTETNRTNTRPEDEGNDDRGCNWRRTHMLNRVDLVFSVVNLCFSAAFVLIVFLSHIK